MYRRLDKDRMSVPFKRYSNISTADQHIKERKASCNPHRQRPVYTLQAVLKANPTGVMLIKLMTFNNNECAYDLIGHVPA